MQKTKVATVAASLLSLALNSCQMSISIGPKFYAKPFQAKFEGVCEGHETESNAITQHYDVAFDGKDHLRVEHQTAYGYPPSWESAAAPDVSIADMAKKKTYLFRNNRCTGIEPLQLEFNPLYCDPAKIGTPIGTMNIDGHACHGWKLPDRNGYTDEAWVADDLGVMYKERSVSISPPGTAFVTRLTDFNKSPDASLFTEPAE